MGENPWTNRERSSMPRVNEFQKFVASLGDFCALKKDRAHDD
jgi:hypothetical protein